MSSRECHKTPPLGAPLLCSTSVPSRSATPSSPGFNDAWVTLHMKQVRGDCLDQCMGGEGEQSEVGVGREGQSFSRYLLPPYFLPPGHF